MSLFLSSYLIFFHCVVFINHITGFTVELRHSCKMHLALIKCAASSLFVISGRSGARIKSAVRLQILSFLGLQSIAFLPHSIPYSASSFSESPLTIAALTGPENDARWWQSHNHQSHCSSVRFIVVCAFLFYICVCGVDVHFSCCFQSVLRIDLMSVCVHQCGCVV